MSGSSPGRPLKIRYDEEVTMDHREINHRRACRRIEQVHTRLDEIDQAVASDTLQDWEALLAERRALRTERDRLSETITAHNVYARAIR